MTEIHNCLIVTKPDESADTLLRRIDGYAIVPRADYEAKEARLAEAEADKFRVVREWAEDSGQLHKRLAEAERLLRPFAALAQAHQQSRSDADPLFGINSATITHGNVRDAAKFLRATDSATASDKP